MMLGMFSEISFDVTVIDNTAPVIFCAGAPGVATSGESFAGSDSACRLGTNFSRRSSPMDIWFWSYSPLRPAFPTNAAVFDDDAAGQAIQTLLS